MRELPGQQLNPRIKNVWRISDAIMISLWCCICLIPFVSIGLLDAELAQWALPVAGAIVVLWVVLLVLFLVVVTPIRYSRWRFELTPEFLEIARGIIWRKRFVIPFIRVQNTDTKQGPILRAFHLSNVTVSTAAGEHEIPGLDDADAEAVRDRAAELARIAREDV